MSRVDELIDSISAALRHKSAFDTTIYKDEPILRPASRMKQYLPPPLEELKSLGRRLFFENALDEAAIFYKQAMFAADLTDDYPLPAPFLIYSPSYRTFTDEQLRGYFTWRTAVRQSNTVAPIPAYQLLYATELIHLIGTENAAQAFDRLHALYARCDHEFVRARLHSMLTDMYIYYRPARPLEILSMDTATDEQLYCLARADETDDDTLFKAIDTFSSYHFERSRFFKSHPVLVRTVACDTYRRCEQYCQSHNKRTLFERLFGAPVTASLFPFRHVLFHAVTPPDDCRMMISSMTEITCRGGVWQKSTAYTTTVAAPLLGDLMKGVDAALRRAYRDPHPLKTPDLSKAMQSMIDEAITAAQKPSPPIVTIDLSKLEGIRNRAAVTRDRLLVDEEVEDVPRAPVLPLPPPVIETGGLTDTEYNFLRCLLYGGDLVEILRRHRTMPSLVADSINDKLFDRFSDTVIDFDGDTPVVIDDYLEELKGMIVP